VSAEQRATISGAASARVRPLFRNVDIEELACPGCGGTLAVEAVVDGGVDGIRHGIVRCRCYRYPIVEGILSLVQGGPFRQGAADRAVDALAEGDTLGALTRLLLPAPRDESTLRHRLRRVQSWFGACEPGSQEKFRRLIGSETFTDSVRVLHEPSYGTYLTNRWANPSFLSTLALIQIYDSLRRDVPHRVLDLCCGAGHASFLLQQLFPELAITAVDHDFSNLYLARNHLLSESAILLCLDVEKPLPLRTASYGSVLCLDAFHYIGSKRALCAELRRVVHERGLWVFPHLHNALVENFAAGVPLDPETYRACFDQPGARFFTERALLEGFVREGRLDLTNEADAGDLDASNAVVMVAGIGGDVPDRWNDSAAFVLRRASSLGVNPLYQASARGETLHLERRWPDANLAAECRDAERYLPAEIDVEVDLLERIRSNATTEADAAAAKRLIESFVVVPVPQGL
jgi:SAM-dependent methyltransferase